MSKILHKLFSFHIKERIDKVLSNVEKTDLLESNGFVLEQFINLN